MMKLEIYKKEIRAIVYGTMMLVMMLSLPGQSWALPTDSNPVPIVRMQWQNSAVPQSAAAPPVFFMSEQPSSNAENHSLLSAFQLPALPEPVVSLPDEPPINCIITSITQGCWFDPAMMRLVSPLDLVRHMNPKERQRR